MINDKTQTRDRILEFKEMEHFSFIHPHIEKQYRKVAKHDPKRETVDTRDIYRTLNNSLNFLIPLHNETTIPIILSLPTSKRKPIGAVLGMINVHLSYDPRTGKHIIYDLSPYDQDFTNEEINAINQRFH